MNAATTNLHCGTIPEFMADRLGKTPNVEQLEAFAREFYQMALQIVSARENSFSLGAQLNFPRLPQTEQMNYVIFAIWADDYFRWVAGLFDFELEILGKVRVTWS